MSYLPSFFVWASSCFNLELILFTSSCTWTHLFLVKLLFFLTLSFFRIIVLEIIIVILLNDLFLLFFRYRRLLLTSMVLKLLFSLQQIQLVQVFFAEVCVTLQVFLYCGQCQHACLSSFGQTLICS